jgi:hypothetical protein
MSSDPPFGVSQNSLQADSAGSGANFPRTREEQNLLDLSYLTKSIFFVVIFSPARSR